MKKEKDLIEHLPTNNPVISGKLSDQDIQFLEMAKLTRKIALKDAEKALAENNAAEITYKYIILQLYMKYGLNLTDVIDENGNILKGANNPEGNK